MGASRTWGAAVACRTVWMSIGGISSLKSGPSSAMPCLERRRLGIQSANSPPRARFCRRSQFAHEFEWNVGALNPICPLGTVSLYLSVQLFNRSEVHLPSVDSERLPANQYRFFPARNLHMPREPVRSSPDNLFAEQALQSPLPTGRKLVLSLAMLQQPP
jgi:hypothetical protein